jgi:hypothetical protein
LKKFASWYNIWVLLAYANIEQPSRLHLQFFLGTQKNEKISFLKRIITSDEKWMFYKNIMRKYSWDKPGPDKYP